MKSDDAQVNRVFLILSALAMLLVVCGHAGAQLLSFGGLFPYYSFHMALFVFISGYFYRSEEEAHPLSYLVRKFRRLLIPYFLWNLVYGIVVILMRRAGFYIGNDISLRTLFIDPFLTGHQFGYNAPGWFVPALFLTQSCNIVLRVLLRRFFRSPADRERTRELGLFVLYLLAGMVFAYLAGRGSVYEWRRIPGRVMYMLPFYEGGRIYRLYLEGLWLPVRGGLSETKEKDPVLSRRICPGLSPCFRYILLFAVLFGMQAVTVHFCYGIGAVSVVWCTGFVCGPIVPYTAAFTGIFLWLAAAKLIAPAVSGSRFLCYFGRNTFAVMMHQIMGFMAVKAVCCALCSSGILTGFDREACLTDVYYIFLPGGNRAFLLVYIAAGILLPLAVARLTALLSGLLSRLCRRLIPGAGVR